VFAEARDFRLYDFFTADGHVDEDVFAYSNRSGHEHALVLYHNRYASTAGWIRESTARAERTGSGEEKALRRTTLGDGLGLTRDAEHYCIFRDHLSGLEFIRGSQELVERGLYAQLEAYSCHVFLDFREVRSTAEHPWAQVAHELGGRGVPSVDEWMHEIALRPVLEPFAELVDAALFRAVIEARTVRERARATGGRAPGAWGLHEGVEGRIERLAHAVVARLGGRGDGAAIARRVRARLVAVPDVTAALPDAMDAPAWGALLGALLISPLGAAGHGEEGGAPAREWIRAFRWNRVLGEAVRDLGTDPTHAEDAIAMAEALVGYGAAFRAAASEARGGARLLERWLADDRVQRLLRVNQYEGTWWLGKEPWEALLAALAAQAAVEIAADETASPRARGEHAAACSRLAATMMEAALEAGYRLDGLVEALTGEAPAVADPPRTAGSAAAAAAPAAASARPAKQPRAKTQRTRRAPGGKSR
jgi:hypothetical protein